MRKWTALFLLPLLGAGCADANLDIPSIAQPIDQFGSESPVAQERGFADLPSIPQPPRKPGARGSIRVLVEFPDLPPLSTVLRLQSGQPNLAELQNLAQALELPEGSVARPATTQNLILEWLDDNGMAWSYSGADRILRFNDTTSNVTPGTATFSDGALFDLAVGFLRSIGYKLDRVGTPYFDRTPSNTAAVIQFNAQQDGQGIWSKLGTPLIGVTLELDRKTGQIKKGSLLMRHEPLRSDYPSIPREEAQKQLAAGGQGGTPEGDVTLTELSFEWFQIESSVEPPATYLYPALIGTGSISFRDGRTGPYRIVVPLVQP